jgi:hypothetical protein
MLRLHKFWGQYAPCATIERLISPELEMAPFLHNAASDCTSPFLECYLLFPAKSDKKTIS